MDQIRKEIHTAFFNVSQLCEQFFQKYPQNYPPKTSQSSAYPIDSFSGYQPASPVYNSAIRDPWLTKYSNQSLKNSAANSQNYKLPNTGKNEIYQKQPLMKKMAKDEKKNGKKLTQYQIEREKEQKAQKKKKQLILKKQKKLRNTLKNLIRKDPRYAQKPKLPMSPYFLFLQEMRTKNAQNFENPITGNKLLAEIMGKQWREMTQESKKPYIASYLKEKKIYDEKLKRYYEKYPDLKPKASSYDKPMYSVEDPKYQLESQNEVEELETDLIDELRSEEEDSPELKGPDDGINNESPNQDQVEEQYEEEYEWNQQNESEEKQKQVFNHIKQIVEID